MNGPISSKIQRRSPRAALLHKGTKAVSMPYPGPGSSKTFRPEVCISRDSWKPGMPVPWKHEVVAPGQAPVAAWERGSKEALGLSPLVTSWTSSSPCPCFPATVPPPSPCPGSRWQHRGCPHWVPTILLGQHLGRRQIQSHSSNNIVSPPAKSIRPDFRGGTNN